MRLRRRRGLDSGPVVHRIDGGRAGLVIGLHGYGSDERQLETLLPLDLPVTTLVPRAPFVVAPGYGWWLPGRTDDGRAVELAPTTGIDAAVAHVVEFIRTAQESEAFHPGETFLVGYSQGAALALAVAARHPELLGGVITGAGALVVDEVAQPSEPPLDVFVMNGRLDPVVTVIDHARTVATFAEAGHQVTERLDHVPHVIDLDQARHAADTLAEWISRTQPAAPRHPVRTDPIPPG